MIPTIRSNVCSREKGFWYNFSPMLLLWASVSHICCPDLFLNIVLVRFYCFNANIGWFNAYIVTSAIEGFVKVKVLKVES